MCTNDPNEYEHGLWNARIEQNEAGMRANDPKE